MTDLQVKAQANEIAEQKNAIEQAKLDETVRSNKMKELLTDLENLGKYGYVSYQPGTDQGWYARSNAQGVTNMPMDFLEKFIGSISGIGKFMG